MIYPEEVHSLTDFLNNYKRLIGELKERGRPKLLTVNGRGAVVLQDATSFQRLIEEHRRLLQLVGSLANSAQDSPSKEAGRFREAIDLHSIAIRLIEQNTRRRNPSVSEEEVKGEVARWLRHHEGAEKGDGPGRSVSPERIAKILGE